MRGGDELHAALRDGARRSRLELDADLVDDDALRHVVLHRLDHHRMLQRRRAHLHATRAPDAWMRYVAVSGDLVRGVDDDDALAHLVAEHARTLAQHRGLADARRAEQQDGLAADHDVLDDVDGSGDGAAHAARETDDLTLAIADGADAVQRPLDAGAVVVSEVADVLRHVLDVGVSDVGRVEERLAVGEACLRLATEVEHDLQ